MNDEKLNSNSVALAGEFLVLAQLTARGHVATLTLGNTKNVDILVSNPKTKKFFNVEVKTSTKVSSSASQFGNALFWHMGEKHELIQEENLFYCFVYFEDKHDIRDARFFIVPSKKVADYVKEQDRHYHEDLPHKNATKHTKLRMFRIALDSAAHGLSDVEFENKWDYFG